MFAFAKNIYCTSASEDIVILNGNTDKYHVINDVTADQFNRILNGSDREAAAQLTEFGLIVPSPNAGIVVSQSTIGFFDHRWMKPIVSARPRWADTTTAMIETARTAAMMRRLTLSGMISDVETSCLFPTISHDPLERIQDLIAALNVASLFGSSGKCLPYSHTLTRLGKKRGIPLSMVIGVRTRPFFSHAWVEFEGRVISDDPDLRKKLAVIAEAKCY
jgi:hypothetical protein